MSEPDDGSTEGSASTTTDGTRSSRRAWLHSLGLVGLLGVAGRTASASTSHTHFGEDWAASASADAGLEVYNTATSGTAIGLKGRSDSPDGFGLHTPDDAKIGGTVETDGDWIVEAGTQTTGDAGNVVAGHASNRVDAGADGATIGGGGYDDGSVTNPNVVTDNYGTVGGGRDNQAGSADNDSTTAEDATVGGGRYNEASGTGSTVGGGEANYASGTDATVGGGTGNDASGTAATTSGGEGSVASGDWSTAGGGYENQSLAEGATIGGGLTNVADDTWSTVGGGRYNEARGDRATVGGGNKNVAKGPYSTIGGGDTNRIVSQGEHSTVGGGEENEIHGPIATVSGGQANVAAQEGATVGGGAENIAEGPYSTITGGIGNRTGADFATVGGGYGNLADGAGGFAAGQFARAENRNSFVWADGSTSMSNKFSSSDPRNGSGVTGPQTFHVLAEEGVRMITSGGTTFIPGGSAGWSVTSTRTAKTNVDPVDPQSVLDGVESMEVSTWEYEDDGEGAGVRHVGPMAEQFHEEFDVGDSDEHINSINADGVALAAIQGLSERLEQRDERIEELEAENEDLRERLDAIEERIDAEDD